MALPQLNHKNVVRYFGCWAERINAEDEKRIQERVKKIKSRLALAKQSIKGKIKENKREYKVSKFEDEEVIKKKTKGKKAKKSRDDDLIL
jgi:hypothetical protein